MEIEQAISLVSFILNKNLSDLQELVLRKSWEGYGYQKIANDSGYDHDYIKRVGSQLWRSLSQTLDKKVAKGNIKNVLKQYWQQQNNELNAGNSLAVGSKIEQLNSTQDWQEAVDTSIFFGRELELNQCENWIVEERFRLITILGMGGVGKTAIAAKLARNIAGKFDYVIWRSLRNAPLPLELLTDLILFISGQQEIDVPNSIGDRISCLMKYMSASRCLLILDNAESILLSGERTGSYRQDYQSYGQLFRRLADEPHQSCLIITSREQPIGIGTREGCNAVRSLQLSGLSLTAAQEILKAKEIADSQQLIEQYQGNPLALKIAATTIKSLFAGDVGEFLIEGTMAFGGIWDLLEQQFNRLSSLEQSVMYWLAINREWITLSQLKQDLVPLISARHLLEILESLQKRSLIETGISGFSQQPVVMEYITDKIIDIFEIEIRTGKINLLLTHPIIKADSKDYLRETQVRLILKPVVERLLFGLGDRHQIAKQLQNILQWLRHENAREARYAVGNILNLLKYLKIDLTGWDFADLQVWQADLRNTNLQGVTFARADLSKSVFTEKMGSIFAVDFSPDEKLLATGDDNRLKIWQMPECKQIMTLPGHDAPPVWTLAFSPDGLTLASGSSDRTIRLWNVATGQCLKILKGHQGSVWSLAFSPDGTILASSSEDNTIKLWQIETGEITTLPAKNPAMTNALAFSPDGSLLAASDRHEGVKIWRLSTSQCIQTIATDADRDVSVAFSPSGELLAVGFPGGTIKFWHMVRQVWQTPLQGHTTQLTNLRFSADGKILASSSVNSSIRLWQVDEARCTKLLQGHQARVSSIAIASFSQILASGSEDGSVRIWDIKTGQCLRLLSGHSNRVWSIAFSADGQTLASGNETGVVRLWDIQTGDYQELEHFGRVKSVAFSPDGQTLASANYNYEIELWDLGSSKRTTTIKGADTWCWSVAFSPDSKTIVTCGGDELVRCWEVATGKLINILAGHQGLTLDTVFLGNSYTIATTSADRTVKLWNLNTGECWKTLEHDCVVWSIAYYFGSNLLATGSEDGNVKLWHIDTGKCFATLKGHTQIVVSVAFSHDGSLIASGGNDRTIRLWEVATKRCVKTIDAHQDSIFGVAFSSQANLLASASHDETIKLWNIHTEECLQVFQAPRTYEQMDIKDVTGLTEAQKDVLKALGAVD